MIHKFVHQPAHCLVGIPDYTDNLQYPLFKNCISLTESEVEMLITQQHQEYVSTLVDSTPNKHCVVMLDMYASLMISLKVYDRWWRSVKYTDKDV